MNTDTSTLNFLTANLSAVFAFGLFLMLVAGAAIVARVRVR